MNPAFSTGARRLVVLVDLLCLVASAFAAFGLHHLLRGLLAPLRGLPTPDHYLTVAVLIVPTWLGLARVLRLHQVFEEAWPMRRLVGRLVVLHVVGFFALSSLLFVTQSIINRSVVGLFLLASFATMLGSRALMVRAAGRRHASGEAQTRVLVVGAASSEMQTWLRELIDGPYPAKILGRLGEAAPPGDLAVDDTALLGEPEDLVRILESEAVDHVVFFPPCHRPEEVTPLLAACEDRGIPASFQVILPRPTSAAPRVFEYEGRPFVTFELAPRSAELLAIKHGFDLVVGLLLLVLATPVLLVCALAILLFMGRPVLFVQARAGRNGRTFRMLKLRTMERDAESKRASLAAEGEREGPTFKMEDDPRVTRLGQVLRRFSLDELPQLVNVVTGSMSLVGPRPLPLDEQRRIQGWHRRRLAMKPGITGLWQVSGRSDIGYGEWMRLDVRYVDTWSLRLDLEILLKTLPAVLRRRGAY